MVLKFIYSIFIGILFATLVGVGIAAFYPEPKYPEYPPQLSYPVKPEAEQTEADRQEQIKQQQMYEIRSKAYEKTKQTYNRNVSIIAVVFAIAALVISLTLFKTLLLIADGLLFGGLVTLVYSIIRGFETDDNIFRFIVVAIGFVVAVVVGYIKFAKPAKQKA
jgi:hypothetical protein